MQHRGQGIYGSSQDRWGGAAGSSPYLEHGVRLVKARSEKGVGSSS